MIEDGGMQFAERFKAEAEAMARLNHPGVVAVYDAGETPGGLLYIVMEFVEGTDVSQMIRSSGKLPPDYAYSITAHVCDALAYAHANGLIHRDIKPANIMVDKDGRVKVADFGLAKMTNENSGFTQTNMAVGTPDFVAPEALYPGVPLDGRADLYAVGVMLYQMLTGSIPRGAFKPASVIAPGVDPRFDQIVLKAMQVDREERYSSAMELRQHLDTLLIPLETKPDLPQQPAATGLSQADMTGEQTVLAPRQSGASAPQPRPVQMSAGGPSRAHTPPKKTSLVPVVVGAVVVVAVGAFFLMKKPQPAAADQSSAVSIASSQPVSSSPSLPVSQSSAIATKDAPFINTLGMKFVPVPITGGPTAGQRVLFSVWETRVQDFEAFVKESGHSWSKLTDVDQGPTYAVAGVSWEDATAFCAWLTQKERSAGKLGVGESYRLPSDHEWSCAVGIGEQEDAAKLPGEKNGKLADVFPWGSQWPPPANSGNYWSEELRPLLAAGKHSNIKGELPGYRDGHAETAPVGSFPPGGLGLHDLGGNVWEWCEEWFDASEKGRVLRGGSWDNYTRGGLLSSLRYHNTPAARSDRHGFRCVVSVGSAPAAASVAPSPSPQVSFSPSSATKDAPFINSLGMKFVPVEGTNVLFCIHETRYQDYAAHAADAHGVATNWKNQSHDGFALTGRAEEHPVTQVSWEDAQAFCAWLSKKEGKTYRLPTDEEWSIAVGLGRKEKHDKNITPAMLSGKENTEFPWGGDFPPKTKDQAGNYSDASRKAKAPRGDAQYLEDYDDGFPTTAPVMSFKPNKLGLYDLGGNVWEWCEDWYDNAQKDRVLRGGSWINHDERTHLLSSRRFHYTPGPRSSNHGFRLVLVVSGG
jgi:formylglycine-generating enzyme required for sulfatase activity/serine/threonine protein kinase